MKYKISEPPFHTGSIHDYARPEPRKSDSYATVACGFLLIVTVMGWAFLLVVMGGAT